MREAAVADRLAQALGGRWRLQPLSLSGFAATWRAEGPGGPLLLKAGDAAQLEAEADGLAALAATGTIAVPALAGCWRLDDEAAAATAGPPALLAMAWLSFAPADAGFGERFGHALGALHAAAPAEGGGRFGWRRDNRLGATPQPNPWHDDWPGFFAACRLAPLAQALRPGDAALADAVEAVIAGLPRRFADGHRPRPSLIHGDLWSGNWAMRDDGAPVIYDPAVSVSDAEAELAMMTLFGAPPAGFWPAYQAAMPAQPGQAARRPLYQLHHLLNHAWLFGGGYRAQALALARSLA